MFPLNFIINLVLGYFVYPTALIVATNCVYLGGATLPQRQSATWRKWANSNVAAEINSSISISFQITQMWQHAAHASHAYFDFLFGFAAARLRELVLGHRHRSHSSSNWFKFMNTIRSRELSLCKSWLRTQLNQFKCIYAIFYFLATTPANPVKSNVDFSNSIEFKTDFHMSSSSAIARQTRVVRYLQQSNNFNNAPGVRQTHNRNWTKSVCHLKIIWLW